MALPTYAAEDPGSWQHLFDTACAADLAGVDRVVMSDHVVYGENLEAYARPELGGSGSARGALRAARPNSPTSWARS
jgi:hypothetical protein